MQPARLILKQLKIHPIIGVYSKERKKTQTLYVDLAITLDIAEAITSDNVSHALDYDTLIHSIRSWSSNTHFYLIESLAFYLSKKLLEIDRIQAITITLHKPKALRPFAKDIAIEIVRQKKCTP